MGDGKPKGKRRRKRKPKWRLSAADGGGPAIVLSRPPTIAITGVDAHNFSPKHEEIQISYEWADVPLGRVEWIELRVAREAEPAVVIHSEKLAAPYSADHPWDGTVTGAAFDGYVNLTGSPYLLTLAIKAKGLAAVTSNAERVEILPHSIDIEIAFDPSFGLPIAHEKVVKELEAELGSSTQGRVILDSPVFMEHVDDLKDDKSFSEYRSQWSNGARLPFLATLHIKDKAGAKTRCPEAIAKTKILWDVAFEPEGDLDASLSARGLHPQAKAFVKSAASHQAANTTPPGVAAHDKVGGLRASSTKRWLPLEADWKVSQPAQRTWSGHSECKHDAALDADGGVLFVSGRMAGDKHRVTAYIDADGALDDTDQAKLDAAGGEKTSRTFELTTWRRIEIVGNFKSGASTTELDLDGLAKEYEKAAMIITPATGVTVTDMQAEWKQHYQKHVRRLAANDRFIESATLMDPGVYPVSFEDYVEYRLRDRPDEGVFGRLFIRFSTFLGAGSESGYIHRCNNRADRIYNEVVKEFPLASNGLTLFKFGAYGEHNRIEGSFVGGVAPTLSGYGTRNEAFLFVFREDEATDTFIHEVGHCLFLAHAPGHFTEGKQPDGNRAAAHDANDVCTMSYAKEKKGLCGLCLLKLAGWEYRKVDNAGSIT